MAIGGHLKHRCDVFRAELVTDEYENKRRDFGSTAHLSDVRCLYVVKSKSVFDTESGELQTVKEIKMIVGADEDVEEGDRVTDIVLESETLSGDFDVVAAIQHRRARSLSHKTLMLRKVK